MPFFKSIDVPAVGYCDTAQMIQTEVMRLRNLDLPVLRGVQVVVHYRTSARGQDTFVITFTHKEMDETKKTAICGIILDKAFLIWLKEALKGQYGKEECESKWGKLRVRVTSRENSGREYVWSIEGGGRKG